MEGAVRSGQQSAREALELVFGTRARDGRELEGAGALPSSLLRPLARVLVWLLSPWPGRRLS